MSTVRGDIDPKVTAGSSTCVITVALVLLLIICLVFYRRAESNQEAQDKAEPADRRAPEGRCARRAIAGADRRCAR